ncbi:MAG TPA: CDP-glycerol glycerophosphotransferase family protein [Bacillales bacterium]
MNKSRLSQLFIHIKELMIGIVGWVVAVPLNSILPAKNIVIFIGRNDGRFVDNVKYMYLHMAESDDAVESYFLAESQTVYDKLRNNRLPALLFPRLSSLFKLLQASAIVVDNAKWHNKMKYHLLKKSYKVQLWHGVGMKRIRGDHPGVQKRMKNPLLGLYRRLSGSSQEYDLFVSTSPFYTEEVFSKAFDYKQVINSGYPRNDVLLRTPSENDLIETDEKTMNEIKDFKKHGYKVVLYAPTFRNNGGDAFTDQYLHLDELSAFAKENKVIFIIKLHPKPDFDYQLDQYDFILEYDNSKDVYPALSYVDMMITDYSSIYMDYLLLNRPVLFFPYDYEEYARENHDLTFDYNWITPGPKAYNQHELEREITNVVNGIDGFEEHRREIRNKAFQQPDGHSAERVGSFIKKNYMKQK